MHPRPWIGGLWTDLVWFSFGWIPLFAAFVLLREYGAPGSSSLLLVSVLVANFLHRHLTFPLVYGDVRQFNRHRIAYIVLPPIFLVATFSTYLWHEGLFRIIQWVAILWTFYHVIMQKVGLLRIYSRKSGVTQLWLDKFLPLAWLGSLVLLATTMPGLREEVVGLFVLPDDLVATLAAWQSELWIAAWLALAAITVVSVQYVRKELAQPCSSAAKLLYALSILLLYGTFYYDVAIGYAVITFSHAVEYIAFVNVYARKKYRDQPANTSAMAHAVGHQVAWMMSFGVLMVGAFWIWSHYAPIALSVYITGSSFLHFIYDGWIWKTRDPVVGQPLGISYAN